MLEYVTVKASNCFSGISATAPTDANKLRTLARSEAESPRPRANPVRPRPLRDTGLTRLALALRRLSAWGASESPEIWSVGAVAEIPEKQFDAFTVTYSSSHGLHALRCWQERRNPLG